ncbi:unnamed protein product [Rhizophagus irregularis]|uniref:FAR1 domain-containing protein n=1 Tax=Rhizophagus irregularis TaxID=588596 RepID=A0A915YSJ0_9GLOM|nr:unnamed protein product [Rhizophagus irregularis]CAB5151582.1 unnamed protein product [Rhizophagus irregularis]CAB5329454.1 unnamed protein product [Rhizophagus irregularis]CAB5395505.1 unnamed protein product [Rhizophagus irregularis]
MFSNNNNTHPYDNTHNYNNIRDNIPNNNTLFYDAYENFLYDNTHESLPPTYDNNTYYENLSYNDYETSNNEDELVELTDSLKLIAGLTFNSWNEFKSWINRFALKEGFSYKIRSSEKIEGMIQRVVYECIKSGSNTSQVTFDPTKRHNASFSKTSCSWKLNVTCPKTSDVIKINFFNNEHNHSLTLIVHEIAPRF